ncbi:MAG: hypothetical protein M0027_15600 [Candidatus Dormibacteraeota bacterium]|nr:hypothetical protein [Candidatus Dormibacteraeota bacterium]
MTAALTRREFTGSSMGPGVLHFSARYAKLVSDEGPETRGSAWAHELIGPAGESPARVVGRFTSDTRPGPVLDAVAEVALLASDGDASGAQAVSKSAWDAALLKSQISCVPSAEAIRKRFAMPWRRVLRLAFTDPSLRPRLLGQWDGSHFAGYGSGGRDLAIRALQAVSLRLGHAPAPIEFDLAVQAMEARRSLRRSGVLLPRSQYIANQFSSWDGALAACNLQPPQAPPPRHPVVDRGSALDNFIDEYGVVPPIHYFEEWCRRLDIPTKRRRAGWKELVAQVRGNRAARGAATPAIISRGRSLPPLPEPLPRRKRVPHRYTREEVLASLRRYGELYLPAGVLPRQKHYLAMCREDQDLIWPASVGRFGPFHAMCREAGIE